jgi:hypothetical protein
MLDNHFQTLSDDDMVSVTYDHHLINSLKNFQSRELYTSLRSSLKLNNEEQTNYQWLNNGVESRLLKASKSTAGWLTGHTRLCLAFRPENLELDAKSSGCYLPEFDDVLEITDSLARLTDRQNTLISELTLGIRQKLNMNDPSQSRYYWLDRGIEGKVLKASGDHSGWQSGLLRLQFEFMPSSKQPMAENSAISQPGLDSLRQPATN